MPDIACGQCGVIFHVKPNKAASQRTFACSRKCRYQLNRLGKEVPCAHCGRPKWVEPGRASSGENFFCSMECKSRFMTKPFDWNPTPAVAAYIAGIIDGEGSICLVASRKKGCATTYVHPLVSIVNTSETLIEWLIDQAPFLTRARPAIPSCAGLAARPHAPKACHRVQLSHGRAVNFLRPIAPYLIIKKSKAERVIEFWDLPIAQRARDARGEEFRALVNEWHGRSRAT